MRPVPQCAVEFIQAHEGCPRAPISNLAIVYLDQGGKATVAYGHLTDLPVGATITEPMVTIYLDSDLDRAATALSAKVKPDVIADLTGNQYGALIAFVFNCGVGKPGQQWDIWRVLNRRQYDQVPAQLARFVTINGVKNKGLVNRRAAEQALWAEGEPGTADQVVSSASTREVVTPQPVNPSPMTAKLVAGGLTVLTTTGGAVASATSTLTPFSGKAHMIDGALTALAVIGAGLAVATVALTWLSHHQHNT
jgi:lysozyme